MTIIHVVELSMAIDLEKATFIKNYGMIFAQGVHKFLNLILREINFPPRLLFLFPSSLHCNIIKKLN
jgi:hypothetical protein